MSSVRDFLKSPWLHRWTVTIVYRTNEGSEERIHHVLELDEVADLVEAGPSWMSIEEIKINPHVDYLRAYPRVTLEEAARL